MIRISFEIPEGMAETAILHIDDLAHVHGLTVMAPDGEPSHRLSDERCPCGRRLHEERRGPVGTWVRYCPLHGEDYGGAA